MLDNRRSRWGPMAFLAVGLALASTMPAAAQGGDRDRDMDRLREQLMDCVGPDCVADRDRMMDQLRTRLQDCTDDCEPYREELRLHERLRDCDAAGQECPQIRAEERMHWQRGHGGPGRGQGNGQGSGQGSGQGDRGN